MKEYAVTFEKTYIFEAKSKKDAIALAEGYLRDEFDDFSLGSLLDVFWVRVDETK